MSEPQDPKAMEVDESREEKNLFVVDPDDYQKTRKLKAINDAKDHVRELRKQLPKTATPKEWSGIHSRTSEAVALYGHELLPLIEDALEEDILKEDDLETEYGSLEEFVGLDGHLVDHKKEELVDMKPPIYMAFYRQLERIQRKLGLGLELQEDRGPARI